MAINYKIKQGDCIYCIISDYGLLADTVWNHQTNSQLRAKRKDLTELEPGDIVFIPDIRTKEVIEPTNQVHKFFLKSPKHKHWIEIELIGEDDKPIPNEKYKVILPDGIVSEGTLNQNGWVRLECFAAGNCKVTFPELDEKAYEFIKVAGPKPKSQ